MFFGKEVINNATEKRVIIKTITNSKTVLTKL
jgi:hypothetical protein